jgi:ADP-ribosylglycohydrolase
LGSGVGNMLGAIAGDMIGSPYEYLGFKEVDFPLFSDKSCFTDDTVLTVAVADAMLHKLDFAVTLKSYGRRYPDAGYGGSFYKWMLSDTLEPYKSLGNGSAMRTSPIGFLCEDESAILKTARKCSMTTHNHSEGIKGSQAVSYGIYLARKGRSKQEIRDEIQKWFGYNLNCCLAEIRPGYRFDITCQGTVPPAFIAFLESEDFESAVRNAVSLGGDADTLACIAGSLAEAFYKKIPSEIVNETRQRLPQEFLDIIDEFYLVLKNR